MTKLYCTQCPKSCLLSITGSGVGMVVDGGQCPNGEAFAESELSNPGRILTTTVRTNFPDVPVISVRTETEIPKDVISEVLSEINDMVVSEELGCGDTLIEDAAGTGVRVIVTSYALMNLGAELENKNVQLSRASSSAGSDYDGGDGGIGVVRNSVNGEVLDDIGSDAVGGVVGAAGEAVGVEDGTADEEPPEGSDDGSRERPSGRARIGRN